MSKRVCGIDLGTGNSAVAIVENGKAKVIVNSLGNNTTPSVVFIKGDERKVGTPAKNGAATEPKNTVSFIKRFMGANYNDADVQKMIGMVNYDVKNVNGKPHVVIDNKTYSPEEISSIIVAHMQQIAKDYCGEDIKDVVITCPAWFNDVQRQATKQAGELAGFNVLRILNEPTAAILSSDIDVSKGDKVILVNDLGCGTEDVSICECSDGMIEVKASYGDVFLGGQNYDQAIIDWIVAEFKKEQGIDLSGDKLAMTRLAQEAEKAKIALSSSASTDINIPYITAVNGVPAHLNMSMTRSKFEQLTASLTDKVVACAKESLRIAKENGVDHIDEVLLVGGSSRIPAVQDALAKAFNVPLNKSCNFDEAVALGAAIQANTCVGGEGSENSVLLLDVTPISLGINVNGGQMHKLIEANTTIPTRKTEVFTTAVDNQPAVDIEVLQGERPMASDNKLIGNFQLDGIMPARRGVPQIEVTFDIDANGILSVTAKDKGTNKEQHITVTGSGQLSKEEIEQIKANAEKFKAEDEKKLAEVQAINAADGLAFAVKKAVEENADKLTDEQKTSVNDAVTALEDKVRAKNVEDIKTAQKALEDVWYPIASSINGAPAGADGAAPGNPFENMPGGNPFDQPAA